VGLGSFVMEATLFDAGIYQYSIYHKSQKKTVYGWIAYEPDTAATTLADFDKIVEAIQPYVSVLPFKVPVPPGIYGGSLVTDPGLLDFKAVYALTNKPIAGAGEFSVSGYMLPRSKAPDFTEWETPVAPQPYKLKLHMFGLGADADVEIATYTVANEQIFEMILESYNVNGGPTIVAATGVSMIVKAVQGCTVSVNYRVKRVSTADVPSRLMPIDLTLASFGCSMCRSTLDDADKEANDVLLYPATKWVPKETQEQDADGKVRTYLGVFTASTRLTNQGTYKIAFAFPDQPDDSTTNTVETVEFTPVESKLRVIEGTRMTQSVAAYETIGVIALHADVGTKDVKLIPHTLEDVVRKNLTPDFNESAGRFTLSGTIRPFFSTLVSDESDDPDPVTKNEKTNDPDYSTEDTFSARALGASSVEAVLDANASDDTEVIAITTYHNYVLYKNVRAECDTSSEVGAATAANNYVFGETEALKGENGDKVVIMCDLTRNAKNPYAVGSLGDSELLSRIQNPENYYVWWKSSDSASTGPASPDWEVKPKVVVTPAKSHERKQDENFLGRLTITALPKTGKGQFLFRFNDQPHELKGTITTALGPKPGLTVSLLNDSKGELAVAPYERIQNVVYKIGSSYTSARVDWFSDDQMTLRINCVDKFDVSEFDTVTRLLTISGYATQAAVEQSEDELDVQFPGGVTADADVDKVAARAPYYYKVITTPSQDPAADALNIKTGTITVDYNYCFFDKTNIAYRLGHVTESDRMFHLNPSTMSVSGHTGWVTKSVTDLQLLLTGAVGTHVYLRVPVRRRLHSDVGGSLYNQLVSVDEFIENDADLFASWTYDVDNAPVQEFSAKFTKSTAEERARDSLILGAIVFSAIISFANTESTTLKCRFLNQPLTFTDTFDLKGDAYAADDLVAEGDTDRSVSVYETMVPIKWCASRGGSIIGVEDEGLERGLRGDFDTVGRVMVLSGTPLPNPAGCDQWTSRYDPDDSETSEYKLYATRTSIDDNSAVVTQVVDADASGLGSILVYNNFMVYVDAEYRLVYCDDEFGPWTSMGDAVTPFGLFDVHEAHGREGTKLQIQFGLQRHFKNAAAPWDNSLERRLGVDNFSFEWWIATPASAVTLAAAEAARNAAVTAKLDLDEAVFTHTRAAPSATSAYNALGYAQRDLIAKKASNTKAQMDQKASESAYDAYLAPYFIDEKALDPASAYAGFSDEFKSRVSSAQFGGFVEGWRAKKSAKEALDTAALNAQLLETAASAAVDAAKVKAAAARTAYLDAAATRKGKEDDYKTLRQVSDAATALVIEAGAQQLLEPVFTKAVNTTSFTKDGNLGLVTTTIVTPSLNGKTVLGFKVSHKLQPLIFEGTIEFTQDVTQTAENTQAT